MLLISGASNYFKIASSKSCIINVPKIQACSFCKKHFSWHSPHSPLNRFRVTEIFCHQFPKDLGVFFFSKIFFQNLLYETFLILKCSCRHLSLTDLFVVCVCTILPQFFDHLQLILLLATTHIAQPLNVGF